MAIEKLPEPHNKLTMKYDDILSKLLILHDYIYLFNNNSVMIFNLKTLFLSKILVLPIKILKNANHPGAIYFI